MALDFHIKNSPASSSPSLFQLAESDLAKLEPAFAEFQRRTGIIIDPYGRTQISTGLYSLLAQLSRATHPALSDFLNELGRDGIAIVLQGD